MVVFPSLPVVPSEALRQLQTEDAFPGVMTSASFASVVVSDVPLDKARQLGKRVFASIAFPSCGFAALPTCDVALWWGQARQQSDTTLPSITQIKM